MADYLLYVGHTGVSTDSGRTIFGFHPDTGNLPLWLAMRRLRNGDAFPGVVRDDTQVFATAAAQGLKVTTLDVIVPDPRFQAFRRDLTAERKGSRYTYGFPNGDCNCTTWLERLGVPLLTGNMDEFASLSGFVFYPSRRFGECVSSRGAAMKPVRENRPPPEKRLGILAMRFRGTRDEAERDAITADYARAVAQLIASRKWREVPPLEDQLPDERMPEEFYKYWTIK